MSKWLSHVKSTMKSNKGKSFSQVLKLAAKTYKKHGGGEGAEPATRGDLGGMNSAGTAAPAGGRRRSRRGRKTRRGTRRH